MRDRRPIRFAAALVAAAAVALIAGCTSGTGGQATPAGPPSTNGSDLTNSSGSIHLSSPPKDIPLAGVDPCQLLTQAQQKQLQVNPGVERGKDQQYGDPHCTFQYVGNGPVPTTGYFDLNTVSSAGLKTWLDPTLYDSITQQNINGYPGLQIYPKGGNSSALECSSAIGVADGQMLMVMFDFVPLGTPQQQACAKTKQVAEAAMTTLQSMK